MTSCSANWTTPANVSYQSGDFGSTQASAQICTCSSCVTQSKGAIVPQSSICKLYPLPINYVFQVRITILLLTFEAKESFFSMSSLFHTLVSNPHIFFLFLAPGASILAWVFGASRDVLQPN